MRVVLAGFMGTGKTVVGRGLAERRGLRFVDLDSLIEQRAGMSVPEIFAARGEKAFRALEKRLVGEVCVLEDVVVAVGGGTVVDDESRAALHEGGVLICLQASPEIIARRVGSRAADRPMLAGHPDLVARIRELQAEREPAYGQISLHIDTSDLDVGQVIDSIDVALGGAAESSGGSS